MRCLADAASCATDAVARIHTKSWQIDFNIYIDHKHNNDKNNAIARIVIIMYINNEYNKYAFIFW